MSATQNSGAVAEVFLAFFKLGLTSFGGPVARLGYFRDEFVVRRKWLDERAYADLVALCQLLPEPASSQVGMAIGLSRAGYAGAGAAFIALTLPSAIALVIFYGVVALGVERSLTPDNERASVAVVAAAIALAAPNAWGQVFDGNYSLSAGA